MHTHHGRITITARSAYGDRSILFPGAAWICHGVDRQGVHVEVGRASYGDALAYWVSNDARSPGSRHVPGSRR